MPLRTGRLSMSGPGSPQNMSCRAVCGLRSRYRLLLEAVCKVPGKQLGSVTPGNIILVINPSPEQVIACSATSYYRTREAVIVSTTLQLLPTRFDLIPTTLDSSSLLAFCSHRICCSNYGYSRFIASGTTFMSPWLMTQ